MPLEVSRGGTTRHRAITPAVKDGLRDVATIAATKIETFMLLLLLRRLPRPPATRHSQRGALPSYFRHGAFAAMMGLLDFMRIGRYQSFISHFLQLAGRDGGYRPLGLMRRWSAHEMPSAAFHDRRACSASMRTDYVATMASLAETLVSMMPLMAGGMRY